MLGKNGYTVIDSGKYINLTKELYNGTIPSNIYLTYSEALERKRQLLSYRSNCAKKERHTTIILKVKDGKTI